MAEVYYADEQAFHVAIGTYAGIFWRMNLLPKANTDQLSHQHPIPHVTMLVRGKVRAEIEGRETKEYIAPAFIPVPAECPHRYTALEDKTLYFCIFNVEPQGMGLLRGGTSLRELEQLTGFLCGDCPGCDLPATVNGG